ncbi:MAG: LysR family transcriptional regulator [Albidovulum sp.]
MSVLELGRVTRAANALGITQSAVSQMLRRLREMTGDPLLVRSGSKLVPTIRADKMLEPLRASLKEIDSAFHEVQPFDPALDDLVFRIASAD